MTNRDTAQTSAKDSTPVSQKPDTELKDNELDEVSGGVAMAKPTKKPDKDYSNWP